LVQTLKAWRDARRRLLALGALACVLGATAIVRVDLAQRREAFLAEARDAHRLLGQGTARLDAVLATLALLAPPGPAGADATARLPALYPQVLAAWRREAAGGDWPDAAARSGVPLAALAQAEARSRGLPAATRHAVLAGLDTARGRYTLVLAGTPASYALQVDARQLVAPGAWPWRSGQPMLARLVWGGQAVTLQDERGDPARPRGLTRGFTFEQTLASASQDFGFQAQRLVGPAQWPWAALVAWALLCAGATALALRGQRQRAERRRAAELERLARTARLGTLGELAAGVAHELNQPLTAALSGTQTALRLLRDEPLAAPTQATVLQALELAAAQVRRAGEVLARLRRQMQPGAAPAALAPVELGVLVRHLGVLWAPELARHAIAWRVEGQAPPALGDAVAAEQVLHNLLGNAVQALQLGPSTGRQITLRLSATLTHACCAVRDNGPGVPAAAQARLFAPFFSTRDGGLGLGLPLCQTLALAMNGAVRFQVPVGGGAEFVLELPLARTSPAPP